MHDSSSEAPLETLRQIRGIMERSGRFLSLSGWSGVWAGSTALAAAFIAHRWMAEVPREVFSVGRTRSVLLGESGGASDAAYWEVVAKFLILAVSTLGLALAGGLFFTIRKTRREGGVLWSATSRQLLFQGALPLVVGGVFALACLYYGQDYLIAPACLCFYGLALVNASRHTLGEIRYLGYLEIILGLVNLFLPGYGLYFWALGFGVLHVLYGIFMWNKYDRRTAA